ncbi:hypothetical protein EVAR_27194_1 [Eumeta japonica]|uniref:Uncharacterized protein n=1 Tax=Eumeta variegata TaxID=151549 RepID=A0A4C1VVN8_EUMVA|nr:hypothetical protein EVAR_27194_1 [Eumeta japonica]
MDADGSEERSMETILLLELLTHDCETSVIHGVCRFLKPQTEMDCIKVLSFRCVLRKINHVKIRTDQQLGRIYISFGGYQGGEVGTGNVSRRLKECMPTERKYPALPRLTKLSANRRVPSG